MISSSKQADSKKYSATEVAAVAAVEIAAISHNNLLSEMLI